MFFHLISHKPIFAPRINDGSFVFQDQTGGVYRLGVDDGKLLWYGGQPGLPLGVLDENCHLFYGIFQYFQVFLMGSNGFAEDESRLMTESFLGISFRSISKLWQFQGGSY